MEFNTMSEGLQSIFDFNPSTSVMREIEYHSLNPQRSHEYFSHVPVAEYANPLFQSSLSVPTHYPLWRQPESSIVGPNFHYPTSHPISTNLAYSPSYQVPQIQSPFSQATDFSVLPQREPLMVNPISHESPTCFPTSTNSFGSSSSWFPNTSFQGSFDTTELACQASDGKFKQQSAYGEMQSYAIDFNASSSARRNCRLKIRRDSRSQERRPYQISEKRSSKYNRTLQACLLLTNGEAETKTLSSHGEMKLLVMKRLQNSDVGNLGRVVLPKKAVEAELPPLQMKEGLHIPANDYENNFLWNFKFRFWPNNKSRMYILENTGDFIRQHGLKKGDFLMLYEVEGRYVIRGMKATESEHSNSSTCTTETMVQSSEDGGDQISLEESVFVSQGMENTNIPETTPEISQSISPITEEEENIMDHEPELLLDISSTHSEWSLLVSQGIESTNILETTPEISQSISRITEEEENIMDHEPELPLDISSTHSEGSVLISQGIENTNIPETTPEINQSILVSQGMENINIFETTVEINQNILPIEEGEMNIIDFGSELDLFTLELPELPSIDYAVPLEDYQIPWDFE